MATKPKTKKEEPKKDGASKSETTPKEEVVAEKADVKEPVTKEEVKDLVEKTVDEALKEKSESEEKPSQEQPQPGTPEVTPVEGGVSEPAVSTPESSPTAVEAKPEEAGVVPPPTGENAVSETNLQGEGAISDVNKSQDVTAVVPQTPGMTPAAPVSSNVLSTPLSEPEKKKKSPFLLLFFVFVLCGIIIGASIWYLTTSKRLQLPAIPFLSSATPTPVVVATPTPEPVKAATYKVSVLNGSGVAGAAGLAKNDLVAAGFSDVTTGNAPKSASDTTIAAKSTVPQNVLEKLSQTLSAKYSVSSDVVTLDASNASDIVVTLGKAK